MTRGVRRSNRMGQEPPRPTNPMFYILKGVTVSVFVSLLFSAFLATISLISDLASIEHYMPYIITGASICSVFIGSVYATQKAQRKGLVIGVGIGMIYVLIAAVFDIRVSGEIITVGAFSKKAAMLLVSGAMGGVMGTNL